MSTKQTLQERSDSKCELCTSSDTLNVYHVAPSDESADQSILLCESCRGRIDNPSKSDANHWRCLNDSMWTPVPAVQVMSWRILNSIKAEGWPQYLLDMLYLEDDIKVWAEAESQGGDDGSNNIAEATKDSNGAILNTGDTITLIKDLVVKGANFTAKRGTVVKNISLTDNPKHIEGKVNGTRIVLVSAFLKKA